MITGAASGIGAACARSFSNLGASVVVADVNEAGAQQVAEEIGGFAVRCNVGQEQEINNLVRATVSRYGEIDLFFSNAAVSTGGDPLSVDIDVWNEQWQVNVMAHVYAIRAVLPSMLERESGYLLHTSSMGGILTTHGNLTYATTKHAVVGIAEWMSITYHDRGVRTSLLAPLGVNTPMLGGGSSAFAQNAAGTIREPEEVAQMVVDAIHDERFLILTDDIANLWMYRKTDDLERWLNGMRRMQRKIDDAKSKGL